MSTSMISIDAISKVFLKTASQTLKTSTNLDVTYAPTIQKIPRVSMKPDLTCFVEFNGDYNGVAVINFSESAAFAIYTSYMKAMGMPEEELATTVASAEVSDAIGEITNQIIGQTVMEVDEIYGLNVKFGQPKALLLNSSISLVFDSDYGENRRLSFKIGNYSFRAEIAMEHAEFMTI